MIKAQEILDAYQLHLMLRGRACEQTDESPALTQDEVIKKIKGLQPGEVLNVYLDGADDGQE